MSRVKVYNVSVEDQDLEIKTLDRAKGNMYLTLRPFGSVELEEAQLSDQIKVLARAKRRRAALLLIESISEELPVDTWRTGRPFIDLPPDEDPPVTDEDEPVEDDQEDETDTNDEDEIV